MFITKCEPKSTVVLQVNREVKWRNGETILLIGPLQIFLIYCGVDWENIKVYKDNNHWVYRIWMHDLINIKLYLWLIPGNQDIWYGQPFHEVKHLGETKCLMHWLVVVVQEVAAKPRVL